MILTFLVFCDFANASGTDKDEYIKNSYTYTIQDGDELGTLMYSMGLNPLWGDDGFVSDVGTGPLFIKVFLNSDTSQDCILSELTLSGEE